MNTLGEIKASIETLAAQIDIPAELLPSFGKFVGQYSYVYMEGDKYHWVVRGNSPSVSDIETPDPDEVIYQVLASLTEQMGWMYEVVHRDPKLDHRRVVHRHQLELLGKLSLAWEQRRAEEIEEMIKWYPYKDSP